MSITNAFHDLIAALHESLEGAKSTGARAFESGEFEKAQTAADKGKAIHALLEEAEALQARWEAMDSDEQAVAEVEAEKWGMAVDGEAKDEDLIYPVLYVLDQAGGNAPAEEILDRVEGLLRERLTSEEFQTLSERWEGPLRDMTKKLERQMTRRGMIHTKGHPGNWNLTPQGRMTLLEQQG